MNNKLYIGYIEKEIDYIIGTIEEIKNYKYQVIEIQLLEDSIINDIMIFLKSEIYNTKMKNKDLKIICDTHWKEIRGYINKDLYFNINLDEEFYLTKFTKEIENKLINELSQLEIKVYIF